MIIERSSVQCIFYYLLAKSFNHFENNVVTLARPQHAGINVFGKTSSYVFHSVGVDEV